MSTNYGMMCPHGYGPTQVERCPACTPRVTSLEQRAADRVIKQAAEARRSLATAVKPIDAMKASMVNARLGELATPTPTKPPAKKRGNAAIAGWDGLCTAGTHGLDFYGQPCTLCSEPPRIMIPTEARQKIALAQVAAFDIEVYGLESHVRIDEHLFELNGTPLPPTYFRRKAVLEGMKRARQLLSHGGPLRRQGSSEPPRVAPASTLTQIKKLIDAEYRQAHLNESTSIERGAHRDDSSAFSAGCMTGERRALKRVHAAVKQILAGTLLVSLVACSGSTVEVTTVGHDPGVLAPYGDDRVFGGYRNEICTQLGLFACDAACYVDTEEWIQCRMDWQTTCAGRATTGIVVVPASGQWPFDACADALAQRACASDPRAVPAACTWIIDQGR